MTRDEAILTSQAMPHIITGGCAPHISFRHTTISKIKYKIVVAVSQCVGCCFGTGGGDKYRFGPPRFGLPRIGSSALWAPMINLARGLPISVNLLAMAYGVASRKSLRRLPYETEPLPSFAVAFLVSPLAVAPAPCGYVWLRMITSPSVPALAMLIIVQPAK